MADIAAKIGVVEGTIYKYFESKRELLLKTIEHWYEGLVEQYETDIQGIDGAVNQLRFLIWRHLKIIIDNPLLCRLMFREVRSEHDYIGSDLYQLNRRYTQLLTKVIGQGAKDGIFRQDLPLVLLRDLIYGGMEHHTWNYICGRGELAIDEVADALTHLVCQGVLVTSHVHHEQPSSPALATLIDRLEKVANRLDPQ